MGKINLKSDNRNLQFNYIIEQGFWCGKVISLGHMLGRSLTSFLPENYVISITLLFFLLLTAYMIVWPIALNFAGYPVKISLFIFLETEEQNNVKRYRKYGRATFLVDGTRHLHELNVKIQEKRS